ncbi:MAG: imidazole glycerol phosphate synthase subunit HisH [Fimbriimonadaceae bacterium]
MIALVDYGAGNLFSVSNALEVIGAEFKVVDSAFEASEYSGVLLPGVGHFGQMMRSLDDRGLCTSLGSAVEKGVPLLGICLGMQALFETSEEARGVSGLRILRGSVVEISGEVRVPQIGWNEVRFDDRDPMWFYFANSFVVKDSEAVWGRCEYGGEFSAAVKQGSIWGMQFHPEKSGTAGLGLLKEWIDYAG